MAWPSPTTMCALSVTGELCLLVVRSWSSEFGWECSSQPHSFVFRGGDNFCRGNQSSGCCFTPTIRWQCSPLLSLSTWIKQWEIMSWTCCVISAPVERMHQKIPSSQPPSTLDPSFVSSPAKGLKPYMWYKHHMQNKLWFLLFSSAVLCIPPRPHYGETYVSFHVEQICTGLWCGGSLGGVRGWKLQCKYSTAFNLNKYLWETFIS